MIHNDISFDTKHIWHPYSSATEPIPPCHITHAKGVYLYTNNNTKLIDGMASWWSVIHGYNNPTLNEAAITQLQKMSHVMFGGLTHTPAIELTKKLLNIVPKNLEHVFYSDSGSVAIEVAMKMAIQYWHANQKPEKQMFATIRGGYHGDTWHAMSVCDPDTGMHSLFSKSLPQQFFAPRPQSKYGEDYNPKDIIPFSQLFEKHHNTIAACILEPIVQGAGGMYFYHPQFLRELAALCKKHSILLIADEIATGFGRTGKMFACEHAQVLPDIMCVGKAITGGYLSLAATLCTQTIAHTISNATPGVFMHGPTFMANPLACAIATASITLLQSFDWQKTIQSIETQLHELLSPFKTHSLVAEVRVIGAIGVIELHNAVDMKTYQKRFIQEGIWVRPFGKLVYIMPPYCITAEKLKFLVSGIHKVLCEK
ncbi:MAG: adenosylmethionine--8-amino-7-oxononanoate transaminase [Bacteroidales bacterium]|jgi:adenosylmethionine-8-amino-7-oxononanoate aminotransferase|nr:adenosylmethionine--8-amino-7-oxononanoate transaminase [Bacteroidales bacterium]HPY82762.1 adenosylmethionine--8-amino-7-oxononanoate transaminase [Bacteroidales bacterium]